jgi:putative flavoprotein involved in K+ transport
MYVLGLPFQRRRKSTFLDGVGSDAEELGVHLATHLDSVASSSARSLHNV